MQTEKCVNGHLTVHIGIMKYRITFFKIIVTVTAMLFMFTACTSKSNNKSGVTDEPLDLRLITSQAGLLNNQISYNDDGCYQIIKNPDATANIIYTDAESKVRFYLSSDFAGESKTESNASYIDKAYGTYYPAISSKGLLVISNTSELLINKYGDDALGKIYLSDYSGQNRKVLYTLDSNEWISDTSGILEDGDNIYFLDYYIDNNSLSEKRCLSSVSLTDGRKNEIFELPTGDRLFIIGAFDDNVIMKSIVAEDDSLPWYLQTDKQWHKIFLLNIATKERVDCIEYKQGEKFTLTYGENLIVIDKDDYTLQTINLKSGEISSYNLKHLQQEGYRLLNLRFDIFDNHIILETCKENAQTKTFIAVDLDSGVTVPLTLYDEGIFCGIFAEFENSFLIQKGYTYYSFDYEVYGAIETAETKTVRFVLIDKDDYWNNIPKYIEINDMCF